MPAPACRVSGASCASGGRATYFVGGATYFVGGATYFVDADLGLHILEPLLEDGDECGRWH